jgi:hypothetical protein
MTPLNASALTGAVLTVIALYILGFFPFIPAWAMFLTWACFFHMGGGVDRRQAYSATLLHIGLGIFAAWLSALAVLNNPFDSALAQSLWAPVLIGLVIGLLLRTGAIARIAVTPAIIYGYAGTFAFLGTTGTFGIDPLLSLSFQNALIAMGASIVLGVSLGYLNAILAAWLTSPAIPEKSAPLPS